MSKEIKFTVPRLPLSPNSLRGRHWSVKHGDKTSWLTEIFAALKPDQRILRMEQKRRLVKVALFYSGQPFDPDNLHGALKPILDALKGNQLIVDDSEMWLEYTVSQTKVATAKEKRTEITVTALSQ